MYNYNYVSSVTEQPPISTTSTLEANLKVIHHLRFVWSIRSQKHFLCRKYFPFFYLKILSNSYRATPISSSFIITTVMLQLLNSKLGFTITVKNNKLTQNCRK